MFYQILFLSKVKRSMIINNKHGINALPQEIPNEVLKKISELCKTFSLVPSLPTPKPPPPPKIKILSMLATNS